MSQPAGVHRLYRRPPGGQTLKTPARLRSAVLLFVCWLPEACSRSLRAYFPSKTGQVRSRTEHTADAATASKPRTRLKLNVGKRYAPGVGVFLVDPYQLQGVPLRVLSTSLRYASLRGARCESQGASWLRDDLMRRASLMSRAFYIQSTPTHAKNAFIVHPHGMGDRPRCAVDEAVPANELTTSCEPQAQSSPSRECRQSKRNFRRVRARGDISPGTSTGTSNVPSPSTQYNGHGSGRLMSRGQGSGASYKYRYRYRYKPSRKPRSPLLQLEDADGARARENETDGSCNRACARKPYAGAFFAFSY
ncbi:uncharacterized protein CCOS01_03111 [Colletotrichum costaricense]|uniref:Uncharacterized protein n=1 Tax=Colletotrichum costaricense TaxID=1209916 RepID=A0AAI9Z4L4_9PEZI|nr:uncharacterized protein CCOS01_03111 [Colletotrichum costaricense]KAK1534359.1 hypothetical protein CCOS01_03111 [Colletotrichum costaricense]